MATIRSRVKSLEKRMPASEPDQYERLRNAPRGAWVQARLFYRSLMAIPDEHWDVTREHEKAHSSFHNQELPYSGFQDWFWTTVFQAEVFCPSDIPAPLIDAYLAEPTLEPGPVDCEDCGLLLASRVLSAKHAESVFSACPHCGGLVGNSAWRRKQGYSKRPTSVYLTDEDYDAFRGHRVRYVHQLAQLTDSDYMVIELGEVSQFEPVHRERYIQRYKVRKKLAAWLRRQHE